MNYDLGFFLILMRLSCRIQQMLHVGLAYIDCDIASTTIAKRLFNVANCNQANVVIVVIRPLK
jgi:hypothetical protein